MQNAKCRMQSEKRISKFIFTKQFLQVTGFVSIFCILHFTFCTPVFAVHRYHTSLMRMDYNVQKKTVEISIQLFTHDLVPVLEKRYGKGIDLEKTGEVDKLVLDYLNENFALKNKNGESAKINWVGKEANVDLTYIYVEVPFAESLEGANLQNTIFFESFAEQTNLVICRFEEKKADLLFKVGDSLKEIKVGAAGG